MGLRARGLAPSRTAGRGARSNASSEVFEEAPANVGAVLMGRNMFGGGPGPWGEDALERLVGRGPALPRPGLRPHPPRARAARDGGRAPPSTSSPTGSRRRSSRRRAAAGGEGRRDRRRRRGDPAVPRRRPRRRDVAPRRPGPARRRRAALRRDDRRRGLRAGAARSRPRASPTSTTAAPAELRLDPGPGRARDCERASGRSGARSPRTRGCGRRPRAGAASPRSPRRIASLPRWSPEPFVSQWPCGGEWTTSTRALRAGREPLGRRLLVEVEAPVPGRDRDPGAEAVELDPVDLGRRSPCSTVAASQPAAASRSASSVSLLPGTRIVGAEIGARASIVSSGPRGSRRSRRRRSRRRPRRTSRPGSRPGRGRDGGR